jgi:hypothetical protein
VALTLEHRGFVGQAQVQLSQAEQPTSLNLCIVSRRSIERPGLRYQRRGINADGAAANSVETELIASIKQGDIEQLASYVQTRGSSMSIIYERTN